MFLGNQGMSDDINTSGGPGGRSVHLLRKLETSAAGPASCKRPSLPGAGAETSAGIPTTQGVSTAQRNLSTLHLRMWRAHEGGFGSRHGSRAARVHRDSLHGALDEHGHGCGPRRHTPSGGGQARVGCTASATGFVPGRGRGTCDADVLRDGSDARSRSRHSSRAVVGTHCGSCEGGGLGAHRTVVS